MKITPERFKALIEAYGTQEKRWPQDERDAASTYLRENKSAQQLVQDNQILDDILEQYTVPSLVIIENRILKSTRELTRKTVIDQLLNWLLPHSERVLAWIWRPALVACFPLVCGIYLSNFYSFGIEQGSNSFEEELYMLSLNDYAEIQE